MKYHNKKHSILRAVSAFTLSLAMLLATAYFYLSSNISYKGEDAGTSDTSLPYSPVQENCGIAFDTGDGSAVIIYLNFEISRATAIIAEDFDPQKAVYAGYSVDHIIYADRHLTEGIIDRVGGAELYLNGEKLRYTGVQVTELISTGCTAELKKHIISAILDGISKNGFSLDDLVFIIENGNTTLTVPDCYSWPEKLSSMCTRSNVITIEKPKE